MRRGAATAAITAVLGLDRPALERATAPFYLRTLVGETALGAERDRAAQDIQAEERVGARDEIHAGDGRLRDQSPS